MTIAEGSDPAQEPDGPASTVGGADADADPAGTRGPETNFPEAQVDPEAQRMDALAPADTGALDKAAESIDDAKTAAQSVRQAQRDDVEP